MNENLLIYNVLPGETLDDIAVKVGMSPAEVLDFHNINCGSAGLLWANSLIGISKIVIPRKHKSTSEALAEKIRFLPDKIYTEQFLAHNYSVKESFDEDEKIINLNYQTDISLKKDAGNFFVALKNHSFTKNGQSADDKITMLSLACMDAVWPVFFSISENGKLSGVSQFKDLHSTFKSKRVGIEEFHTGEVVGRFLNRFQENLENEAYFFTRMSSSMLYQVLFPEVDLFHRDTNFERKWVLFPNSFPVNCNFTISRDFSDEDYSTVIFNGKTVEDVSLQEVLLGTKRKNNEEERLDGTVSIMYRISKEHKKLVKAEASVVLKYDEKNYFTHQLTLEEI